MSGYELSDVNQTQRPRDKNAADQQRDNPEPQISFITSSAQPNLDSQGNPIDELHLVSIILLIHGIGTLMPWNMFITANDYFRLYKLMPQPDGLESNSTQTSVTTISPLTYGSEVDNLRDNFLTYVGLASQVPNVIFNALNLLVKMGSGNLRLRVNVMLVIEAIIFVLTIVLAAIDSSRWPVAFFYITMVSVAILNMASGIYQNCIFGTSAKFPGSYTNAVLIGSNASGTFTSAVSLLSIWLAPHPREAAIYYFITALVVIIVCIISYNLLYLNPFFRYYDEKSSNANVNELEIACKSLPSNTTDIPDVVRKTVDAMVPKPSRVPNDNDDTFLGELKSKWLVFKKCWPQCLNVFMTFYVSLALFPAVIADIEQSGSVFSNKYFSAFSCFLVFNLFAMLGNIISGWTNWPGKDRVWLLAASRFLLIPFFLFCNYIPKNRAWPVLFGNDIVFILGNMVLSISSGYLSSLCMMFAPSGLASDEAPKAGMLAAFFLVFGIFSGIYSSLILKWLVKIK